MAGGRRAGEVPLPGERDEVFEPAQEHASVSTGSAAGP